MAQIMLICKIAMNKLNVMFWLSTRYLLIKTSKVKFYPWVDCTIWIKPYIF